jgi:L-ascorbate metabolism protein UlaG (beta-lactamase superfamily)
MSNHDLLAVTRVANSCVLLEIGAHAVLTDPFFTERWHLHRGEPLGLTMGELPPLTAIVASHAYPNHWDLRALRQFPHKASTPVYVSSARMVRQARALGFQNVEHLRWGQIGHPAPGLSVEATPAGRTLWMPHNGYMFSANDVRVFFGGEIRDVALLERFRATRPPADLALLPVNGLRSIIGPPIVMGPAQAMAGARALGARVLVPIHDAYAEEDLLSLVIRRHGSGADVKSLAEAAPDGPDVVCLSPGQRRTFPAVAR